LSMGKRINVGGRKHSAIFFAVSAIHNFNSAHDVFLLEFPIIVQV
jgi:hypothetical protein